MFGHMIAFSPAAHWGLEGGYEQKKEGRGEKISDEVVSRNSSRRTSGDVMSCSVGTKQTPNEDGV